MKHLLLALFALFSLAAAGCSKGTPEPSLPTPPVSLLGTWQGISQRTVETTPAGDPVSDRTTMFAPGTYSIQLTSLEFIVYSGATVSRHWNYTRTGNILQPTNAAEETYTVQELLATRLVLTRTSPGAGNNTQQHTLTYARQP
jgi:hypothetical protein